MPRFLYYIKRLNTTDPTDLETLIELSKVVKADEVGLQDSSRAMLTDMIVDKVVKAIRLSGQSRVEA